VRGPIGNTFARPAALAREEVLTTVPQDMGLGRIFFQREDSSGFF